MAELETAERQLMSKIRSKDVLIKRLEFLRDCTDRRERVSGCGSVSVGVDL